jgi:hypothetical protein
MNTGAREPGAGLTEQPITNFSDCHLGILEQLTAFGELPALMAPVHRARMLAEQTLNLFNGMIAEHHAQEERELFPVVLEHDTRGEEKERVRAITSRLTADHRRFESAWSRIQPALEALVKGHTVDLDGPAVDQLVRDYRGHASFEEESFLPLAQAILGRKSGDLAALSLSLHMRHVRQTRPHVGIL